MKRLRTSISIFVLLLFGLTFAQNGLVEAQIFEKQLPQVGQKYVPGEIIVKFKPNVTEYDIAALNSTQGVSTIYTSPTAGFKRLRIPSGKTVAEMVEIYQADANVDYAEANYIAYAMMVPNDELYPLQWHLYNTEYGGIQMESAWNVSTGSGVVVAIIDTGIAYETYSQEDSQGQKIYYEQAPDLANTHFVTGYDFVNRDEHPTDDSNPGHGTHIAGTIAQNTNNNIGAAGVAFNTYLMPVKVLNSSGAGTYTDIVEGIIWATDHGTYVINLGLGGNAPSKTLENAVAYAYNKGVTVIAAAGNDGTENVSYPAAYDDYVIAVGATRYNETLTYYSNYGPSLDLVAPGGDLNVDQNADGYGDGILQETYEKNGFSNISWGYCLMEGTSMAAAHVSAVAALLIANEIAVTPAEVREALETTAEDKGSAGWDIKHGWGIVNASAALKWKPGPGPEPGPGPLPLAAQFKAEPTSGGQPLIVQFIDESTGNINSWLWDFGDGTTSNQQNPLHTYTDTCHYTVSLTVTDSNGSDTETKENYINAFIAWTPVANFEGQPTDGDAPMSVQFTDLSTCKGTAGHCWENGSALFGMDVASLGGITGWSWDFGDGQKSTEQNPFHTYYNPGIYTVRLTVTGPAGSTTKPRYNYIHITTPPYPVADFVGTPRTGDGPLTVQFFDQSTNVNGWLWNLGDGTTSTEQNPSHTYTYQNTGDYTVSLKVQGPSGSDTKTKYNYIHITTPPHPVADFVGIPRSGDGPLTVQFFDQSSNVNSWLWNFGDGTTSTKQNPSHTYMYHNTGDFTVSLTVQGPSGSDTKTKTNYISLNMPSIYVNIGMSKSRIFRTWHTVTAMVTVTKGNSSGQPIAGVTIEGAWGGGYGGTVSGTTDGNGRVSFGTEWVGGGGSVTFTINKVIIGGKEQDFAGVTSSSIGI